MPWLPLAILLVAALTIAALALILFPPGEGGAQPVGDDLHPVGDEEATEDDATDAADDATTGANLAPPPPGDVAPQQGEGEESLPEAEPSADSDRRPGVDPLS